MSLKQNVKLFPIKPLQYDKQNKVCNYGKKKIKIKNITCHTMPCYVMLCHAMLQYTMPLVSIQFIANLNHTTNGKKEERHAHCVSSKNSFSEGVERKAKLNGT